MLAINFLRWVIPISAIAINPFVSLSVASETIRIDLSPDNQRRDVLAPDCEPWRIGEKSVHVLSVRGLELVLTTENASQPIGWSWWKGGFDLPAAMASDGAVLNLSSPQTAMRLTVKGLTPGKHSIATFHNVLSKPTNRPIAISLEGTSITGSVLPSYRATHDHDIESFWTEFDVSDGEAISLLFQIQRSAPFEPNEADSILILNGIEIDGNDPRLQTSRPYPSDGDEHAEERPQLRWSDRNRVSRYRVFGGTDRVQVGSSEPPSSMLFGETRELCMDIPSHIGTEKGLDPFQIYYWRVDKLAEDGSLIAKGNVWRFRPRRLAFPKAEGHGRYAIGGRDGRVLEVTNLNDSGPGSLRDAVEASGPRTVVFRTGGTIELKSKLVIQNPYITIAGQTAPGDGIAIRGFTFGCLGTHDVVLQHLRIRVGDEARMTMDGTGFASTDHAIMDHCSISWSIDEGVSSRGAGNITVQRTIIAEALNIADHKKYQPGKGHSFAASISGNIGSFHHNLLAHCAGRNWSLAGGLNKGGGFAGFLDIRNNVIYNWEHRTTDGGVKKLNMIGNLYLPGPATRVFHLLKPDRGSDSDPQQYFVTGNRMEGRPAYDTDNWNPEAIVIDPQWRSKIQLQQPFCDSWITEHSAEEAYDQVMGDVGANIPRLDAVDKRILRDVVNRTFTYRGSRGNLPGIIDSQKDVGGWPELDRGVPPIDTDHDGMPDAWEKEHQLNPQDPDDCRIRDESGLTHLERYLASIR